jgi:hypothetical protein
MRNGVDLRIVSVPAIRLASEFCEGTGESSGQVSF